MSDKQSPLETTSKDRWDKAAILGQLVSGIFLVALGLYVTFAIGRAQQEVTKSIAEAQDQSAHQIAVAQIQSSKDIEIAQSKTSEDMAHAQMQFQQFAQQLNLDATNRQIASEYLGKLIAESAPQDRAALLEALDVELEPRYSVPLAVRFTRAVQVRSDICNAHIKDQEDLRRQSILISRTAIALLQRLKGPGQQQLEQISRFGFQPDADIAAAILGGKPRVAFRVSEIDDFADVYVNNVLVGNYKLGQESGWIDVTDKLKVNQDNSFYVVIRNSIYEGTGVRLELRAGIDQYDRMVRRNDWTGEGPAFGIGLSIPVDTRGMPHLNGDNIQVMGPIGLPHC
jgi:hypothetical protein